MRLSELLEGIVGLSQNEADKAREIDVGGLALDSRNLKVNDVFIALAGTKQHGLVFVENAINKGARAVLFDPTGEGNLLAAQICDVAAFPVENLGVKLGMIASRYFHDPSRYLDVIGITGTNGKTSCSQFLGQMLDGCGIIGTLGWGAWGRLNNTANTTPDALTVHRVLAEFVKAGYKAVAMEVSSHGLEQGRVNEVCFKGAIYTNISRDHLDYHGTMSSYLAAKLKLLQMPGLKFVVVNLDDAYSDQIMAAVPDSVKVWGVTTKRNQQISGETICAEKIAHSFEGIEFDVQWRDESQRVKVPLFGDFNTENVLCVLAVMLAMEYPLDEIAARFEKIKPVVGRMERCGTYAGNLSVFIDYAHTPDALARVLRSVNKHCANRLWVVFGCGGNRDAGKRPEMGAVAEQWADYVIVTDDNPRFEDHVQIAKEILAGCGTEKPILIQDRKQAIEYAIENSEAGDCIVIAGKGHENYQEINGIQYPFNDKAIAEQALFNRFGMQ